MQNANSYNEINNDDPAWCVIAEFSLNEGMVFDDIKTGKMLGSLYKNLRDLGVQPGYLNKLEETFAGIVAGPGLPVLVRLLCQRISVDSMSHLEKYRNGGWGYYLIERETDFSDSPDQECSRVVELYLYKEGE